MSTIWTIDGVKEALAAKKISARELTSDFYKRIEARNPELNAFLALSPERARRQTDRIDALVAEGKPLPPLAGVPVAIKDVISTRGTKTTCGSKILENYIPPFDATAVERLEAAGAVILGKTNCDEFAMGSSNENSAYGPVKNPAATGSRSRRLERGLGRRGGGGAGRGGAGNGYGRIDSSAGIVLRNSGDDGKLRAGFAVRADCVRVVAGPHRAVRDQCKGRRSHICRRSPGATPTIRPRRPLPCRNTAPNWESL